MALTRRRNLALAAAVYRDRLQPVLRSKGSLRWISRILVSEWIAIIRSTHATEDLWLKAWAMERRYFLQLHLKLLLMSFSREASSMPVQSRHIKSTRSQAQGISLKRSIFLAGRRKQLTLLNCHGIHNLCSWKSYYGVFCSLWFSRPSSEQSTLVDYRRLRKVDRGTLPSSTLLPNPSHVS